MSHENDKTTTLHINVSKKDIELFDKLYPSCRRRFVQNAIHLTLNDKVFFDKIFFNSIYPSEV